MFRNRVAVFRTVRIATVEKSTFVGKNADSE